MHHPDLGGAGRGSGTCQQRGGNDKAAHRILPVMPVSAFCLPVSLAPTRRGAQAPRLPQCRNKRDGVRIESNEETAMVRDGPAEPAPYPAAKARGGEIILRAAPGSARCSSPAEL